MIASIEDAEARCSAMTDVAIRLALNDKYWSVRTWVNDCPERSGQLRALMWVAGAFAAERRMDDARMWIEWIGTPALRDMAMIVVARELALRREGAAAWSWVHDIERDVWREAAEDLVSQITGPESINRWHEVARDLQPPSAHAHLSWRAPAPTKDTVNPAQEGFFFAIGDYFRTGFSDLWVLVKRSSDWICQGVRHSLSLLRSLKRAARVHRDSRR